MDDPDRLAHRFEAHRSHLRGVAYRMLGSLSEADDAVQEAWLRYSRSDTGEVENLAGWLTTVVARLCLDILRTRRSRREEPLQSDHARPFVDRHEVTDPEAEAVLADAVGLALLVVLDRLSPAERVAYILHDTFGVPFDTIAPIVDRTPTAAKKLASRARGRVNGTAPDLDADLKKQRPVVEAFLAATRAGDLRALLAILDPDVVRRADRVVLPASMPTVLHGSEAVADETRTNKQQARFARLALVEGAVGLVVAPYGRLFACIRLRVEDGKVAEIEVVGEPQRLDDVALAILPA
jgi:RNA polymerase sigma-70 factor (ECF subfamily)